MPPFTHDGHDFRLARGYAAARIDSLTQQCHKSGPSALTGRIWRLRLVFSGAAIWFAGSASSARAGMPSPEFIFTELGKRRWEELSFFLVGFLVMAGIVRLLWNSLRRDFPQWPLISYRRTVALLLLWGLFMTVVLSLISGARELMTPGAWKKNGVTYQLADEPTPPAAVNVPAGRHAESDAQRRLRLDNLRFALWQFALAHEGRFPSEEDQIAAEFWQASSSPSVEFIYVAGLSVGPPDVVLVYEPEIFGDEQYVLLANGAIKKRSEGLAASTSTPESTNSGAAAVSNERSAPEEKSN